MKKMVFFVVLFAVMFTSVFFGQSPLPTLSGYENLSSKSVALSDTAQEGKSFLFEMNTSVATGNRYTKWDLLLGKSITFPKGAKISANVMIPDPLGDVQVSVSLLNGDVVVMNSALCQISKGDWRRQNFQFPEIEGTFDKIRLNLSYFQNESGLRNLFLDGIYTVIGGVETLLDNCNGDSISSIILPNAPSAASATYSYATGNVVISWTDNSTDETGFKIYKNDSGDSIFDLIATTTADATSYTDTSVACGGYAYTYRIVATNAGGDSPYAQTNQTNVVNCVPSAPTGLTVSPLAGTAIEKKWTDKSVDETGFKLFRNGVQIRTLGANAKYYIDTELTCGTSYSYYVVAYNEGGNSVPSNTVTSSTLPCNDSVLVFSSPVNGGEYLDSVVGNWTGGEAELQLMDMNGVVLQNPSPVSSPYVFASIASGDYQLRGRFTNPLSDWSTTVIFKIKSSVIADAPRLTYPLKDATGLPTDPVLQWSAVSISEVKYEVILGTSSGLLNPLYEVKINLLQFHVNGLSYSTTYYWKVRATLNNSVGPWSSVSNFMTIGVTDVSDNSIPTEFKLAQNFPNPFNPTTTIAYQLPQSGNVTLKVFDILGNEVRTLVNEQKETGSYTVQFDASSLVSGLYIYQLRANDYSSIKKMILTK
jgi:hypothetical protein